MGTVKSAFLGVDPGVTGAIAAVDEHGNILMAQKIPTLLVTKTRRELHISAIRRTIDEIACDTLVTFAALERVSAMPKQGVVSMFRFGNALGVMQGLLSGMEISFISPTPKKWMREMVTDVEGVDGKARSVLAASRIWPEMDFSKKSSHNIADALLLAEYARRIHKGLNQ